MISDRPVALLLKIQTILGMWPQKVSAVYLVIAIAFFYVLVSSNIILKLLMIVSIDDADEFIKIFILLPVIFTLAAKYTTFLCKTEKLVKLLDNFDELCSDSSFSNAPAVKKTYLFMSGQAALALLASVVETTKAAALHETSTALWMPEGWKDSETAFWLYFAMERIHLTYFPIADQSFDSFANSCIFYLDILAKFNAKRMRDLNLNDRTQKEDLIKVIKFHQLLNEY